MIYLFRLPIIFGGAVIVTAGSVIAGIGFDLHPSGSASSRQAGMPKSAPVTAVPTAGWYVAHPNIANRDEARCGDNAAILSSAACQNVESAEEQLLADEMHNAALSNRGSAKRNTMKSP